MSGWNRLWPVVGWSLRRLPRSISTLFMDCPPVNYGAIMTDKSSPVYVILGNAQWDFADCQTALSRVSARMIQLPHLKAEDEMISRTRDADALVVSSAPVTRGVMSALEGLKVVVRTGVGYDVIDVPAATELGVIVVNIPDLWIREVANHALALLLAWNRGIVVMDRQVHAGVWTGRVPGSHTGALHGEIVGIVGLGNIGSAFARRVAALDVWEDEPVARDNPLLKMDNVIATPHAAYFSSAAVAQIPRRCGEEIARVLTGQRPLNVVNPEVYTTGAVRRAR